MNAAIAAGVASGLELEKAIDEAKRFVSKAIAQHFEWPAVRGEPLHALNHTPKF